LQEKRPGLKNKLKFEKYKKFVNFYKNVFCLKKTVIGELSFLLDLHKQRAGEYR
jgi:hypothetical protein